MIKRLQGRHKEDALAAARDWISLFAGEQTREATVAAMRFDLFVETVIAIGKAMGKRR